VPRQATTQSEFWRKCVSRIAKVTVIRFTEAIKNVTVEPNGFDILYGPDSVHDMTVSATVIETDDGTRGEYVGGFGLSLGQMLYLAPHLIGMNPFHRESAYDEFKRALRKYDRMGIGPLDIAMWDWAGKKLSCSVADLLGAHRTKVKAYASTYHGDHDGALSTPEDFADYAERCYEQGYRAFKMHGWTDGNIQREIATILLLGKRVGDRMVLMYDAASHLRTFADAVLVGRACDQAGFYWFEDPYRDTGISQHGHRKLRQLIRTPLLIGEHVRGLEAKYDMTANDGTDFVRVNPDYDSGITGAVKVAHMAEAMGLDVEVHSGGPAHRHCVAAFRNTNYYELGLVGPKSDTYRPRVYKCDYSDMFDAVDSDGYVPVPIGPGLGVTYDWDRINQNKVEQYVFD
jgi:L-alanine-DL-glutamate epimerase-like enolase superfamily enzyme